jgi:hypothetical protein
MATVVTTHPRAESPPASPISRWGVNNAIHGFATAGIGAQKAWITGSSQVKPGDDVCE